MGKEPLRGGRKLSFESMCRERMLNIKPLCGGRKLSFEPMCGGRMLNIEPMCGEIKLMIKLLWRMGSRV